jgi:hypothetical protein
MATTAWGHVTHDLFFDCVDAAAHKKDKLLYRKEMNKSNRLGKEDMGLSYLPPAPHLYRSTRVENF